MLGQLHRDNRPILHYQCKNGRISPISSLIKAKRSNNQIVHPLSKDMGVANWFSTFCLNIRVRNADFISKRYKAVTRRLNIDFWGINSDTAHSLYVGSYGRNTAIGGFSDLDIIFCLPRTTYRQYNNYNGNGQSALLQAVRSSIKKTYSVTNISADGLVVLVPFNDGLTFEIVPGFINKNGYIYPNSNNGGSWKVTNPSPEIKAIRDRNAYHNNNLVPLCKMMRAWKHERNVPIGGLLIDTLAYQFIIGWEYKDKSCLYYDFMCRDFFKYAADQDKNQTYWKAPSSGQHVHGRGLFQYEARYCYNISLEAIAYETAKPKKVWSAKRKWREIFGTSFPH